MGIGMGEVMPKGIMGETNNYILTTSGKKFEFFPIHRDLAFLPDMIAQFDLDDIVTSMSRIRRFGGHGKTQPLSVAQHSWLVGKIVEECLPLDGPYTLANYTPRKARVIHLKALTHDFSEAYLGDIPRPLKHSPMMRELREYDEALQYAIYKWLGLSELESRHTELLVRAADAAALCVEAENGFGLTSLPEGWDMGLKEMAEKVALTRARLQGLYLEARVEHQYGLPPNQSRPEHKLKMWVERLVKELRSEVRI